ncbi:MAG: heavy metal-associated domain-containing protein [Gammaproteobacteria bacterium]|nr:heavy metal-associated domain-containing protein [Gammaproteobacteria bacterium]
MILEVENIKCGGCVSSIRQKLSRIESVAEVSVDIESGRIEIASNDSSESLKSDILAKLTAMGYPEKGSVEGMKSMQAKATSYVSCAIGRMTDKD